LTDLPAKSKKVGIMFTMLVWFYRKRAYSFHLRIVGVFRKKMKNLP
jgi:hypothetical protein